MSVNEILQEMEKLSPDDRQILQQKLDQLNALDDFEETPEMLAAIDEGLRSLREERSYTLEELRAEMRTWTLDSK
jgi:hypothetical protein